MSLLTDATFCYDTELKYDEPMRKHCSFCVGGNAKYYAEVNSLYSLRVLIESAENNGVSYRFIGNGTNILVADDGFDGLIISLNNLNDIYFTEHGLRVMAGANLQTLLNFCLEHNLSGLEGLAGIPASVGGAVVMNAGAFNSNISNYIEFVETLKDGEIVRYGVKECGFGYRKSKFLKFKYPVISVCFNFPQ